MEEKWSGSLRTLFSAILSSSPASPGDGLLCFLVYRIPLCFFSLLPPFPKWGKKAQWQCSLLHCRECMCMCVCVCKERSNLSAASSPTSLCLRSEEIWFQAIRYICLSLSLSLSLSLLHTSISPLWNSPVHWQQQLIEEKVGEGEWDTLCIRSESIVLHGIEDEIVIWSQHKGEASARFWDSD